MKRLALVVVVAAVAAIGGFMGATVRAQNRPTPPTGSAATGGRYQMFFSPHLRADTFLVDTDTGKIWQLVKYTDLEGEPMVWEWRVRLDTYEATQLWTQLQTAKKK